MKKIAFFTLVISIGLFACKKNSSTAIPGGTTTNNASTKNYGEFVGAEVTVDSSSSTSQQIVCIATFYKYPDSVITDAGTVKAGGQSLIQIFGAGSPYLYFGAGTFSGSKIPWTISGSGTVSSFNYTCSKSLPSAPTPTSALTINRSMGYTFTCTTTIADSIEFDIDDGMNSVTKVLKGNATSYTFSASELNSLVAGNNKKSYISVKGINYESAVKNGKGYSFQSVKSYIKYKINIL